MTFDMQVVTRGRYMAPGTPFTDVDKPLHLHITPGACSSEVLSASLCALHLTMKNVAIVFLSEYL